MHPLLSSQQAKAADEYTIKTLGIPEAVLMEHAALGVTTALNQRFSGLIQDTLGIVVAGPGNNGGDALAVARQLYSQGLRKFSIVLLGEEASLSQGCRAQLSILKAMGIAWRNDFPESPAVDWIVDGIFGTGLTRDLEGNYAKTVARINAHKNSWILSIDIPSGLSSETGNVMGSAIRACETVALGFYKKGLVTGEAADYVGKLSLSTIQIPRTIPGLKPDAYWYEASDAKADLPERRPTSHKGTFGHVYIWAGIAETQGATALSAMAALKAGAGLVTVVGDKSIIDSLRPRLAPEIMTAVLSPDLFEKKKDAIGVIGPGLGVTDASWHVLQQALKTKLKLVIDADAITLLSQHAKEAKALLKSRAKDSTVFTPHPKEASRLTGGEVNSIQSDRYKSCSAIVREWGSALILKGKGSLTQVPEGPTIVVSSGNSALAKGGSGDVLAGVVASLWAQTSDLAQAIRLGVFVHGEAATLLSQRLGTERSELAGEIVNALTYVWKELEA